MISASKKGYENAEMIYTVYSARINAFDSGQIAFLNHRIS